MLWRISGEPGRWLEWDAGQWTADTDTDADLTAWEGQPVALAVAGPNYQPTSRTDPVWTFLAARQSIPGPHTITGTPPTLPPVPSQDQAGIVH